MTSVCLSESTGRLGFLAHGMAQSEPTRRDDLATPNTHPTSPVQFRFPTETPATARSDPPFSPKSSSIGLGHPSSKRPALPETLQSNGSQGEERRRVQSVNAPIAGSSGNHRSVVPSNGTHRRRSVTMDTGSRIPIGDHGRRGGDYPASEDVDVDSSLFADEYDLCT